MSICCYIGLGSNLRSPTRQIHQAIQLLRQIPHSRIQKKSSLYRNAALGLRAQPAFCNAVIALETTLSAKALLHYCQAIEAQQGRVRKKRWGARTLDIDLLLYGQQEYQTPTLTLPHPRLTERDFVLIPLLEIAPELSLPSGKPVHKD